MVGAEGIDHVDVRRAADAGDLGAECLGDLHGKRADASRCAVDQHVLARLQFPLVVQRLKCRECGDGHAGGLLERDVGGLRGDLVLSGGGELGETPQRAAEDLVAWSHTSDLAADGLDDSGHVGADRGAQPGFAQPGLQPSDVSSTEGGPYWCRTMAFMQPVLVSEREGTRHAARSTRAPIRSTGTSPGRRC